MSIKGRDTIESILKQYPETRSDDMELILKVWWLQGVSLSPTQQEAIKRAISPETCRRYRQSFQEAGYYLATPECATTRAQLEIEHTNLHRQGNFL